MTMRKMVHSGRAVLPGAGRGTGRGLRTHFPPSVVIPKPRACSEDMQARGKVGHGWAKLSGHHHWVVVVGKISSHWQVYSCHYSDSVGSDQPGSRPFG